MHSHDRTLINRLGFRDPDKKSGLHDVACHYLARRDNAKRLAMLLADGHAKGEPTVVKSCIEELISKGRGQYRQHVGFIDVMIEAYWEDFALKAIVEVKIRRVPVGDVIRQTRIYAAYTCTYDRMRKMCVLATHYPVSHAESRALQDAGIFHIRLGAAFDRYAEERQNDNTEALSPEF